MPKGGGDFVPADDGKMTPGQRKAFRSGSVAAQVAKEQRRRKAEFVPLVIPKNVADGQ